MESRGSRQIGYQPTSTPIRHLSNFLLIPPFPGGRVQSFSGLAGETADREKLLAGIRRLRVGGTFWGNRPELPTDCILVRSAAALRAAASVAAGRKLVLSEAQPTLPKLDVPALLVTADCDPWHVVGCASMVVAGKSDHVRIVAALLGVACYLFNPATDELETDTVGARELLDEALPYEVVQNPFTGEPMTLIEAVELCGFWRELIDSNRGMSGALGFSFWKQDHVAPLLWSGSAPVSFLRNAIDVRTGSDVAVWRARTAPQAIAELERRNVKLIDVEDGFLRSKGLGADCVPPLSITVDRVGAHFDPCRQSGLEILLEEGAFEEPLLARARDLRRLIVAAALGKYGRGAAALERPGGRRKHVLVPGQVEDDLAVKAGGCGLVSNLDLLKRVREQAPDAYILYKPHPDVSAGHRLGAVPESICVRYADQVVDKAPIASLIDMVDEVHVNTSLAGFEALLRGKPVTTYGVPFYSGWGLTHDLGPVPARRTAKRTIDELVAAALLLYPRYLDPLTGLPCPAEIIVRRLSLDEVSEDGFVVGARRLQGRLRRRIRSLIQ